MKITLPRRYRIALYVANVLGTPVVVYLRSKGVIGDLELALWGSEVTAAMTIAGLNVGSAGSNAELEQFVKQAAVQAEATANLKGAAKAARNTRR